MDEYRQASFRGLLLTTAAVIVGVILVWQIAAWGLNVLDAPPVEQIQEQPVPGAGG